MANLLKQLELEELSLVDRPANAQAMVSLFKRDDNSKEDNMDKELQEEIETLKADIERIRSENERLTKALLDNDFVIKTEAIEKKAPVETIEVDGEEINKADIPAPILKALEAAEEEKKQHALEKADIELTKRAEADLPHFDVAVAKELVKSFSENEAVMQALKAADKTFNDKMEELGKADAEGELTNASDKLDALVKSYMDENKLTKSQYAKAYAEVAKTAEGKALINKSYKGE